MARVAGVELEDNLRVGYALTKIRGVGMSLSKKILGEIGIDGGMRVSELSSEDISKIAAKMEEHLIEGDLARKVREDIQRLRVIGSYRGLRHSRGLPVRGQRTRSNARTKRGKKKTVGAYRKEALTKMTAKKKEEGNQ
jgi:small subunit ribosomal protein S13